MDSTSVVGEETAGELARFHLLGGTTAGHQVERSGLIPAVLAPYRHLSALRYDYPLVLTEEPPFVNCLTDLVNDAIRKVAARGSAGERLRHRVLAIEGDVRANVVHGGGGTLGEVWCATEREQRITESDRLDVQADLDRVRDLLPTDGRLVDCGEDTPSEVITHLWQLRWREAGRDIRARIDALRLGLEDVLRVEEAHTDEGRSAARLSAGVGDVHRGAFDFGGWSAVLRNGPSAPAMPASRRRRIESAIEVMRTQEFFSSATDPDRGDTFAFTNCAEAAAAYVERVPAMVELVRAMAIAELELQNAYRPAVHDPVFEHFDERSLTPEDVASFPSYLVCLDGGDLTSAEQAQLLDILGSDAPINIVVGVRDVLGVPSGLPLTNGAAPSAAGRRLGTIAIGVGTAFVLQTVVSNLAQVRSRIDAGLTSRRPTLFSVFTGSTDHVAHLPPYLVAAMAMQSRAFPTFTFHPDAGPDWVDRFDLDSNPEPAATWTTMRVEFEDTGMQRRHEDVRVTPVDLAALDRRYDAHFTLAPADSWNDGLRPAIDMIPDAGRAKNGHVPYLVMATEDGALRRVVVDRHLLRETRQYAATWRSLQELAGIDNSHARALLAIEREKWEHERPDETEERSSDVERTAPEVDDAPPAEPVVEASSEDVEAEPARSDGETYIETVRCTTCDECTKLNPKMFAYDENKQAYIADLQAGTYRQLVEAAEACQVAIIHPGTPWDPSEPNLDELIVRAAAFT